MTRVRRRPVQRLIRTTGPRTRRPIPLRPRSPPASVAPSHPWRRGLLWAGAVAGLALGAYSLAPTVKTMLDTVSTDDAYVNGHVTYVAPRVAGQVSRVLVDDNERVKQGGPAGPARQGAVPGPGRHQEGGPGRRRGRADGRTGPGPGHPGPGREPALEAPEVDRGCRRHGRAAPGPGRGPAEQGGDPRPRRADLLRARAPLQPQRDLPRGVRPAPRGRADGRGRGQAGPRGGPRGAGRPRPRPAPREGRS